MKRFSRVMSMMLILALAWAPALPSLAMVFQAGDSHAVHMPHEGNHGDMSGLATTNQPPCSQHDSCDGQCCAFCAQCFGTVSLIIPEQTHSHPVQISLLTALYPRLFATFPDRPPRSLSL